VIVLDTSGLIANYDRSDRHNASVGQILTIPQRRLLSPFVLAELDYLINRIAGQSAALVVLDDVIRGAYELIPFGPADFVAAKSVIERYKALQLGLADASIVVIAERYGCLDLLTLDQRHFRTVVTSSGRPFRLLPFDNSG
jgi:predicted nucleic acid-binding protein